MKLTILGPPRTKKNHGRRIKRGNRVYSVPSEAAVAWETSAIRQLIEQRRAQGPSGMYVLGPYVQLPLASPVSVSALVYRDANRGDLVGYLQAIGDALERGGVIGNDIQIKSWDGSRLLIDREHPRVEIELEAMPG